jgi:hypothetical protein
MSDHSPMKLGRAGIKHDPARRMAAKKILATLPKPPSMADWTRGMSDWGVMANDELGDCTIAGLAHSIQVATANTGSMVTPTDTEVIAGYGHYCGYVPGNAFTDQGGVELDILPQVERDGFAGQKLLGYISPDPKNRREVAQAIAMFGNVYMGAVLPISAQTQKVWDVEGNDGGEWGGHCMIAPKYDPTGVTFVTWGALKKATWDWWMKYVDECHVLLWDSWLKVYPASTQREVTNVLQALE